MAQTHHYQATTSWAGEGTTGYKSYRRDHILSFPGKADIMASSDPAFRGDPARHNPEELLVASVSSCHMLWYLHLCAVNGVVVTAYTDRATGVMEENPDGSGRFTEIVLHPEVLVTDASMIQKAEHLHHEANRMCFIAASVNFPVHHRPVIKVSTRV